MAGLSDSLSYFTSWMWFEMLSLLMPLTQDFQHLASLLPPQHSIPSLLFFILFWILFLSKKNITLLSTWSAQTITFGIIFFFIQASLEQGRSGVPIPSFKFESWSGNSSSTFTSTRRRGSSFPECWTSPTARLKSGSRTEEWKRRSWAEIACSTSLETPCCEQKECHRTVAWRPPPSSPYLIEWMVIVGITVFFSPQRGAHITNSAMWKKKWTVEENRPSIRGGGKCRHFLIILLGGDEFPADFTPSDKKACVRINIYMLVLKMSYLSRLSRLSLIYCSYRHIC